ncbi:hypothetical protein MTR67_001599 [Solanum verrucosum]|uniref:Uncharacterized protein n=1 Tax=Solanum verrucosum TaxID=315347 RepID=A0AAF0T805_SOLVR|nr:hypothetical protein MTR67_001599 [Solanum verrucosum]
MKGGEESNKNGKSEVKKMTKPAFKLAKDDAKPLLQDPDLVLCKVCSSRPMCYTTEKFSSSEVGEVFSVPHQSEGTRIHFSCVRCFKLG